MQRKRALTLFKGSSYEMPKVENYFLVDIYFNYLYSKIKNRVTWLSATGGQGAPPKTTFAPKRRLPPLNVRKTI